MNYFKLPVKTMANTLLFFIVLAQPNIISKKLLEGTIESTFEWQDDKKEMKWSYLMPEKEIIYFKNGKIRKEYYSKNNMTITYLYDKDKNEQYILTKINEENIAYKGNGYPFNIFKTYANYSMKVTKEKKEIQGFNCYKVKMILNDRPDAVKAELWFTDEIDIPISPDSQPGEINDYMIESSICDSTNNCFSKYCKLINKTVLPDSLFELPADAIIKSSKDLLPIFK